ncbi:LuxR family maltose regulon positive regulatory protein [Thermosporothrix hazakensis]|jgi:LuxR family maltose regulon positive regulatory protein|uniref:LuxR family maltose regulon positive regulatory protein n=1 Tax=Thermosporothrix hazakensis TaxID=644383 RepID=A0A326U8X2_THEHA|nr:LuxR C-terminal-related transcriptional regulator [Thermosporothrix hazakensis]PZW21032.1 LuxR family maltose regulon positive regulatory protein [Thermosporothrix hazakensis]
MAAQKLTSKTRERAPIPSKSQSPLPAPASSIEPIARHPQLGLAYLWALLPDGDPQRVEEVVSLLEQSLRELPQESQKAELRSELTLFLVVFALRQHDSRRAVELAQEALHTLPRPLQSVAHLALTLAQGTAFQEQGQLVVAEQALVQASIPGAQTEYHLLNLFAMDALANLYEAQGQLQQAGRFFEHVLYIAGRPPRQSPLLLAWVSLSYASLLLEWNRLEEAETLLKQAIKESQLLGLDDLASFAGIQLERTRGDIDKALELLEHLQANTHIIEPMNTFLAAWHARLCLLTGRRAEVRSWMRMCGLHFDDELQEPLRQEPYFAYMTLARALIAEGHQTELKQASHLLTRLLAFAEHKGFTGWRIEILTLQALTLQAQGEKHQALSVLGQSLVLAEREGYIRLFADEREPMRQLLARLPANSPISPHYLQTLKNACISERTASSPQRLPDPLSARELEVLRLLARGYSNQQIATELIITLNTAKRHVKHILAKLGVTNRLQAVLRAHELSLLSPPQNTPDNAPEGA